MEPKIKIFISGSVGEVNYIKNRIEYHIGSGIESLGMWSAAKGCAFIAEDIFHGAQDILGIKVGVIV